MPRRSKPPAERKEELVAAATALFIEQGYERTSVSDIVRSVGVAQGTFYYHFRAKAEVLEAVVGRHVAALTGVVASVVRREGLDVVDRLEEVIETLFAATAANRPLIDFLLRPGNKLLHERVRQALVAALMPLLRELVDEGTETGVMDVSQRDETLALLLAAFAHVAHVTGQHADPPALDRLRLALRELYWRALAVDTSRS